jgi:hypothetical protein
LIPLFHEFYFYGWGEMEMEAVEVPLTSTNSSNIFKLNNTIKPIKKKTEIKESILAFIDL